MKAASNSSGFSRRMLNLWIGMCRGAEGLPAHLRRLGYDDKWIEHNFANADREPVVPDLIVSSDQTQHTLLLEWKSGQNVEAGQLRRYARVTTDDLRTRAFLREAECKTHDVTVVGKAEFAERLKAGVEEGNHTFPLLVVNRNALRLSHNGFVCPELNQIFSPFLEIDLSKIPENFVPFDQDSDLWEIACYIMPTILVYMCQRQRHVPLDTLASDTVVTWSIMGDRHKKVLRNKICRVLDEAAKGEFNEYLRKSRLPKNRIKTKTWDLVNNPLNLQTDKRSRAFRSLRKLQEKFIDRLRKGGVYLKQSEFDFDA